GLFGLAIGLITGTVWPAAAGLALTGVGMGNWDVAMNVEGAEVERRRGWSLMPRLHAAFSLGTVTGGGVGAASAALGIPLAVQVVAAALLAPASMALATRCFLPVAARAADRPREPGGGLRAWREPRTLLIGVLTLAFGFTEGTANDWLAVALVDGHRTGEVLGAIGFGAFVTAMTAGRLGGGAMLDRFGRVAVLRCTAVLAVAGLLLVILASSIAWVLVGALLWGLGASLGFPVGMSAAADDPTRAAMRVGVVSSVAYTAFLAGPPLVGFLAEHIGILHGLFVVLGALVVGAMVTPCAKGARGTALPGGQG
ncbi:MAG: MFS transporter, partial [Pseudonocardia sp.]|nr:MFS transporter [Pseudonocardia sp.]